MEITERRRTLITATQNMLELEEMIPDKVPFQTVIDRDGEVRVWVSAWEIPVEDRDQFVATLCRRLGDPTPPTDAEVLVWEVTDSSFIQLAGARRWITQPAIVLPTYEFVAPEEVTV